MSLLQRLDLTPPARWASPPAPAAAPVSIAINKPGPFEPGGQQQLAATAVLADGSTRDATAKVRWSSSDETLVKVLPGGLARVGHGAGTATITAVLNGGKQRDSITVTLPLRLRDVVITPENPLVAIGMTEGLTATAVYEDGSRADITRTVEWRSDKPKVASFLSPGACAAHGAGTTVVTATDADTKIRGSARVTVPAAGKAPALQKVSVTPLNPDMKIGTTVQFKAMGHYADKSVHEITAKVKWETSDPRKLTIDARGLARPGLVSGSPLVRASDPDTNLYQSTTVYVDIPGVKSIAVAPRDIRVAAGQSVAVTVTADFHGGGRMTVGEQVQWVPADPRVASVPPGGSDVRGGAEGDTIIEVIEPLSGSMDILRVTVLPPVLTMILIFPAGHTIRLGQRERFTATGVFSDATSRDLVGLTWSSSRRDVVDIDPSGDATGKLAGRATITAVDPASGVSSSVEVTAAP